MKYKGQLTLHSEMCVGAWVQFHDDRGLHGDEKQYWSWDWTINFDKKTKLDKITIFDKNEKVVYEGAWSFSHYYERIICPNEIDESLWLDYVLNNYKCQITTDIKVKALGGDL